MSTFIRRYGRYLNEKSFAYRQMSFDFVRVKKGYVFPFYAAQFLMARPSLPYTSEYLWSPSCVWDGVFVVAVHGMTGARSSRKLLHLQTKCHAGADKRSKPNQN